MRNKKSELIPEVVDYDKLYDFTFKEAHEKRILRLEVLFNEDDGSSDFAKLRRFRDELLDEEQGYIRGGESNYDPFFDQVLVSFSHRFTYYSRDHVKQFVEKELEGIKTLYKDKVNLLGRPEILDYSPEKFVIYLATCNAIRKIKHESYRNHPDIMEKPLEFIQKLRGVMNEGQQVNAGLGGSGLYEIYWSGSEKNKTQFVQLIYGLIEAGLLNEGKGERTKIVEELARVLKVDLSDHWPKNHSESIHNTKPGYKAPIFEELATAYEKYVADLKDRKDARK